MERFVKGDIVVIPFPFSDLSGSKKRPALVLSDLEGDDILLCQITSQQTKDSFAVSITNKDMATGFLPSASYIRPLRIFTADKNIILPKAAMVKDSVIIEVTNKIISVLK